MIRYFIWNQTGCTLDDEDKEEEKKDLNSSSEDNEEKKDSNFSPKDNGAYV